MQEPGKIANPRNSSDCPESFPESLSRRVRLLLAEKLQRAVSLVRLIVRLYFNRSALE